MKAVQLIAPPAESWGKIEPLVWGGVTCRYQLIPYAMGPFALILVEDATDEEYAVVSVNLYGAEQDLRQVYLKTWSENAGLLELLVAAGVVQPDGHLERAENGCEAPRAWLHPDLLAAPMGTTVPPHPDGWAPQEPEADETGPIDWAGVWAAAEKHGE